MNHISDMKNKFSKTDGRLCRYCEQRITFKSKMGTRGTGYQGRGSQIKTNLSLDRWDPRITYETANLIWCCVGCNDRKRDSTPDDWDNFKSYRGKFKFCNMTDKKFMKENADFSIQYALVHFDGPLRS